MYEIEEVWKKIPGYESRYEVSSLGRVKKMKVRRNGIEIDKEKILPVYTSKVNFIQRVEIYKNKYINSKVKVEVRRLVAMAFLGYNPDVDGFVIIHANGDKSDSRLSNLSVWPTSDYCKKYGIDEPKFFSFEVGLFCKEELKDFIATIPYKGINAYLGTFHTEWEAKSAIERFKRIHGIKD